MNQEQFLACLCHGAMMHALPRNKNTLKRMSNAQILTKIKPWMGKVPPKSEKALDNWLATTINPAVTNAQQLADLSELAELEGLGKKLKKLAKKAIAPIKKLAVDPLKKAFKKLEDSSTVKKIARPLAYAAGVVTGTVGLVAAADKARNAAISAKNEGKINEQIYQAQQAEVNAAFTQPSQQEAAQSFMPSQQSYNAPSFSQSLAPQQPQYGAVQRLSQDEGQDTPKVVGLNTKGIMDSIKNNPLPWGIGAAALLFLVMRPSQPQYIYREPK